jgi:putative transposase
MAHRYRLYPTPDQERVCALHAAHARAVWNAALEQFNCWRRGRPSSPGHAERTRQLAEARGELEWLAAGSSSVQPQALRDFDRALRNWWAGTHRRPTWRKRGRRDGFCVRDVSVRKLNRSWAEITVPKAGRVRFRHSRPLPEGKLGMARVTRDGKGRWHVSFPAPQSPVPRESTGAAVGIDRGVANTLSTSDGEMVHAPAMRQREHRRLTRLQRRLNRQHKGSARRSQTKAAIAALHQAVSDRRHAWIEVQTTRLVRECDVICVEDLRVSNMLRRPASRPDPDHPEAFLPNGARAKARLNRSIHAQGWSRWLRRLEEKANASSVCVVRVDPRHTSRECRRCGYTAAENRESQAVFACQRCGHVAHADRHAAENILARGLRALAQTPGSGAERRTSGAARVRRRLGAVRTARQELPRAAEPRRESHDFQVVGGDQNRGRR